MPPVGSGSAEQQGLFLGVSGDVPWDFWWWDLGCLVMLRLTQLRDIHWGTEVKPPSDAGAHKKPGKSRINTSFGVDEQLLQVGVVSQMVLLYSRGLVALSSIAQTHPSHSNTPVKLGV